MDKEELINTEYSLHDSKNGCMVWERKLEGEGEG